MKESLLKNMISAVDAEKFVPAQPGVYCIAIANRKALPEPIYTELVKRDHDILYVGLASKNLQKRLVHQDLRHKSPASFFRSIGAILGYRPIKSNKPTNYQFSKEDTTAIVYWINENLKISWQLVDMELAQAEKDLILEMKPIINIECNPYKIKELQEIRKLCRELATI